MAAETLESRYRLVLEPATQGEQTHAMIGGSSAAHITDYMSTLGGSATYNSSTGMVQITSPNGKTVSVSPQSVPGTANVGGYLYVSDPTAFNNYLATQTGYNASTATVQNNLTSQMAQVLDTLIPGLTTQITPPATTTAPSLTTANTQPMSWEDAMSQAQQIVNPATTAAQQQLTDTYQQNLSQLPYTLAGRGELQSGLMGGGTAGLTQAQASALSQLASQQASNTATLANQIQSGSQSWTESELQNAYDTWAAQQQNAMNLYNTQTTQKSADTATALTTLASILNTMYGGETSASANSVTAIENLLQSLGVPSSTKSNAA